MMKTCYFSNGFLRENEGRTNAKLQSFLLSSIENINLKSIEESLSQEWALVLKLSTKEEHLYQVKDKLK